MQRFMATQTVSGNYLLPGLIPMRETTKARRHRTAADIGCNDRQVVKMLRAADGKKMGWFGRYR